MSFTDCPGCQTKIRTPEDPSSSRELACPRCGARLEQLASSPPSEAAVRHCPYCQMGIFAGARTRLCSACAQIYHANCWDENGGCAVYGCAAAPQRAKGELGSEWAQQIPCPLCSEMIPFGSRVCPQCHDNIERLRGAPSADDRRRTAAQSSALTLGGWCFGLSMVPCLAPVMLLVDIGVLSAKWRELGSDPLGRLLVGAGTAAAAVYGVLLLVVASG